QLIREECCIEVPEQQKQKIEDTIFDLVKICHHKQFLCIHDDVDNLIESALDSKLLSINSINSQRLDKKEQEVKNVIEQPAERRNQSNAENLLPIPSKCEVTLEDEIECNMPAEDVFSPVLATFSNPLFKDNDDFDSSDDESLSDGDVPAEEFKMYSNPLFDEDEINSDKLDPHCFNVESDFVESLLNLQDGNSQQEEIDIVTKTDDVLPPSDENDDDSSDDPLLEEVDLFLFDNSIPPGIENVADDPEGDIRFLEGLLIDDSILSHELYDFNFEDNPSISRLPPEPPDNNFDLEPEVLETRTNILHKITSIFGDNPA
nr:hypothetical protein [Tanacetum cinerariifolium]